MRPDRLKSPAQVEIPQPEEAVCRVFVTARDRFGKQHGINNNVNQMKLRVTKSADTYLKDSQEIEEQIYEIWRIDMCIRRLAVHVPSEKS